MGNKNCYCGLLRDYENCCGIFHNTSTYPKTAEELMRSRYSAFVLANGDYLMQTHAEKTRPINDKENIVKWAKSVKWIGLEIIDKEKGQETDSTGIVEFKANYKEKVFKRSIHERSNFIKKEGKWYYLDGSHYG